MKRFDSWMKAGASNPILITDEEDRKWVVKYRNNPQGIRVLANEWVNSALAHCLGLPAPEADFIYLPDGLIAANNLIIPGRNELVCGGLSFGCHFVEGSDNNPIPFKIANLINANDFPGVVILDTWVLNADRTTNQTNVLVSPVSNTNGKYQYHLVDLGMIVNLAWKSAELNALHGDQRIMSLNPLFMCHLKDQRVFDRHLDKLEAIDLMTIWQIAHAIPPEWRVADEEMDALYEFLKIRRAGIRNTLRGVGLCS